MFISPQVSCITARTQQITIPSINQISIYLVEPLASHLMYYGLSQTLSYTLLNYCIVNSVLVGMIGRNVYIYHNHENNCKTYTYFEFVTPKLQATVLLVSNSRVRGMVLQKRQRKRVYMQDQRYVPERSLSCRSRWRRR